MLTRNDLTRADEPQISDRDAFVSLRMVRADPRADPRTDRVLFSGSMDVFFSLLASSTGDMGSNFISTNLQL